ncbi:MAG: hypothetical protein KDA68_18795, partial [Planctomycetaceae bacterium]|nr:hypothetical protein [Planctomycetaceae bacterium]
EEESILDEQRESYRNLRDFIPMAEDGIFSYYQSACGDFRAQFGLDADIKMPLISNKSMLSGMTKLTGVLFPMVLDPGEVTIGFLLECSWDPEHGLGVRVSNGKVEVGSQDLLT